MLNGKKILAYLKTVMEGSSLDLSLICSGMRLTVLRDESMILLNRDNYLYGQFPS